MVRVDLIMATKDHNKLFNTITVGILISIFSGLVLFMFTFFNETFPQTKTRLSVLEKQVKTNEMRLIRIFDKLNKIYDILLDMNKEMK